MRKGLYVLGLLYNLAKTFVAKLKFLRLNSHGIALLMFYPDPLAT